MSGLRNFTYLLFFISPVTKLVLHISYRGGLYPASVAQEHIEALDSVVEFSENLSSLLTAKRQEDISVLTAQRLKNQLRTYSFPHPPLCS